MLCWKAFQAASLRVPDYFSLFARGVRTDVLTKPFWFSKKHSKNRLATFILHARFANIQMLKQHLELKLKYLICERLATKCSKFNSSKGSKRRLETGLVVARLSVKTTMYNLVAANRLCSSVITILWLTLSFSFIKLIQQQLAISYEDLF